MSDVESCFEGDWVEVERVLLEPADRSSNLPPETAAKPLLVWVKGFARADAAIGETVEVETMTGRLVAGRLTEVLPGYTHTFGKPTPELTHVGKDLRERIATYRASADLTAGE